MEGKSSSNAPPPPLNSDVTSAKSGGNFFRALSAPTDSRSNIKFWIECNYAMEMITRRTVMQLLAGFFFFFKSDVEKVFKREYKGGKKSCKWFASASLFAQTRCFQEITHSADLIT